MVEFRIEFDPPETHFCDTPFPEKLLNEPKTNFYSLANTWLKVKDADISGHINVMFEYIKLEALEQFLSNQKILSEKFGQLLIQK